uniref:Uncharacterized protein n=1 Tax=Ditylenchus dipsaci TaxID=166011 RepID=A0A915DCH2_9BILA
MLPRSDVPFQVSEFIFPAVISPVISRAASHSAQPIKGSIRISNSQEPNALPSTFIKSFSIMPTSGLSSNTIISTSPVSIRGTARTKSSSLGFTYVSTEPCSYQSRMVKSKEASTKPRSDSHSSLASPIARLESIFVSSASDRFHSRVRLILRQVEFSAGGGQMCYVNTPSGLPYGFVRHLKSRLCPYAAEVKSSQLSSTGVLQLNQSPVLKSPSVCTENAASDTRKLECSGIDSPPHVVDNPYVCAPTKLLTPFTGSTIGTYGEDRQKSEKVDVLYALYPTDNFGKRGSRGSSDQSLVIETPRESSTDEGVSPVQKVKQARSKSLEDDTVRKLSSNRVSSSHQPDRFTPALFFSRDITDVVGNHQSSKIIYQKLTTFESSTKRESSKLFRDQKELDRKIDIQAKLLVQQGNTIQSLRENIQVMEDDIQSYTDRIKSQNKSPEEFEKEICQYVRQYVTGECEYVSSEIQKLSSSFLSKSDVISSCNQQLVTLKTTVKELVQARSFSINQPVDNVVDLIQSNSGSPLINPVILNQTDFAPRDTPGQLDAIIEFSKTPAHAEYLPLIRRENSKSIARSSINPDVVKNSRECSPVSSSRRSSNYRQKEVTFKEPADRYWDENPVSYHPVQQPVYMIPTDIVIDLHLGTEIQIEISSATVNMATGLIIAHAIVIIQIKDTKITSTTTPGNLQTSPDQIDLIHLGRIIMNPEITRIFGSRLVTVPVIKSSSGRIILH